MITVAKKKSSPTRFGRQLRALREAAGLTQAQLGERAEMHAAAVGRLETGPSEPNWSTVLKLAEALGADLNDFNHGDGSPTPRSKRKKA